MAVKQHYYQYGLHKPITGKRIKLLIVIWEININN